MHFLTAFSHVIMHSNVILLTALLVVVFSSCIVGDTHPAVSSQLENSSQSIGSSSRSAAAVAESMRHSSSQHEVTLDPVKAKLNDTKSTESHNVTKVSLENSSNGQAHSIVNIPEDASIELSKKLNPEALMRAFYVFVGLSVIVMVYFAWKSFGRRPTQVHRYGVVANGEDLEMAPLDSDEGEEDDTTHFDLSKHRLK